MERKVLISDMKKCDTCGEQRPESKFTADSFSPDTCFKCRIQGVKFGFVAGRENFHGDSLVGGTIRSDNNHTVEMARQQGHDPVPVSRGPTHGLTANQTEKLKNALTKPGQ